MNDLQALHSWEHWSDFLFRIGAISTPAQLQGYVAGLAAGHWLFDGDKWRVLSQEFMDLPEPLTDIESSSAIEAFYTLTRNALNDPDFGFRLILPEDAVSLNLRAEALGDFAECFLNGLGVAEIDLKSLDEQGREMVESLSEIAQIDTDIETNEENEGLFAELEEFLKIAALYLYQITSPASTSEETTTVH